MAVDSCIGGCGFIQTIAFEYLSYLVWWLRLSALIQVSQGLIPGLEFCTFKYSNLNMSPAVVSRYPLHLTYCEAQILAHLMVNLSCAKKLVNLVVLDAFVNLGGFNWEN